MSRIGGKLLFREGNTTRANEVPYMYTFTLIAGLLLSIILGLLLLKRTME